MQVKGAHRENVTSEPLWHQTCHELQVLPQLPALHVHCFIIVSIDRRSRGSLNVVASMGMQLYCDGGLQILGVQDLNQSSLPAVNFQHVFLNALPEPSVCSN